MVDRYARVDAGGTLFFRPIRAIIATFENRRHAPPSFAEAASALERLIKAPPAEFDNGRFLQLAVEAGNAADPGPVTQTNVALIARLAASIEQRGSRLLLFELPIPEEVAAARFARMTRETVHDAIPEANRWLPIEVARDQLRWPDGLHLDQRSAVLVARSIDRAIAALPGQ